MFQAFHVPKNSIHGFFDRYNLLLFVLCVKQQYDGFKT